MKLKWLGHSCFIFETDNPPLRVMIDPYRPGAYDGAIAHHPIIDEVDVVLVTHEHPDHAGVELLRGWPLIVKCSCTARGIQFDTLRFAHDDREGKLRGHVNAFVFEMEGMRIAHLSDIGHIPSEAQYKSLQEAQVLLLPVGGWYTVDGAQAWEICQRIRPNLVFPMHYKTSRVAMDLEPVDRFLDSQPRAHRLSQSTLAIPPDSLPDPVTTIILTPDH